ncbi:hypothetical protein BB561_004302 [Smittium simulii]|uniref:V-type proton ATPase subunit F n=1 Tax=Smittium simulii TaxID=133385 RepID=A0A2T9YH22_9FUNG|nr:hypothetical protein BB561_004302 [Smittium simulii]
MFLYSALHPNCFKRTFLYLHFNFYKIDTDSSEIENTFKEYTHRKDVAIILINQWAADKIRQVLDEYTLTFPTILEIPSKDQPYDPTKDSVLKRVQRLFKD